MPYYPRFGSCRKSHDLSDSFYWRLLIVSATGQGPKPLLGTRSRGWTAWLRHLRIVARIATSTSSRHHRHRNRPRQSPRHRSMSSHTSTSGLPIEPEANRRWIIWPAQRATVRAIFASMSGGKPIGPITSTSLLCGAAGPGSVNLRPVRRRANFAAASPLYWVLPTTTDCIGVPTDRRQKRVTPPVTLAGRAGSAATQTSLLG